MGGHKKANPKSGRGGKKLRGDKKEELIFGRKGIGKEQRDPKGISRQKIENQEQLEITKDDISVLKILFFRYAKDYDSALSQSDLLDPRPNIDPDMYVDFMKQFMRKFGSKGWVRRKMKPTTSGNLYHFYLNFFYRNEIGNFLKNPPKHI